MNTVALALSSATTVAGTRPARQQPAQSSDVASWDATYRDARAAADSDPGARRSEPASNSVSPDGADNKPIKTAAAADEPGKARSPSARGTVIARQGASAATTPNNIVPAPSGG